MIPTQVGRLLPVAIAAALVTAALPAATLAAKHGAAKAPAAAPPSRTAQAPAATPPAVLPQAVIEPDGEAAPAADHAQAMAAPVGGDDAQPAPEPASSGPVVLEGGLSVEITHGQRATVVGDSTSLRAVITEICRQAGVDLRTFGAPDRRYVGRLENVPLADALRSMLRTESYLVGFRTDEKGRRQVTWLRVLGAEGTAAPPISGAAFAQPHPAPTAVAPAPAPGDKFVVSSSLLFQAFGTFDPQRRDQAQREMITRITEPDQLPRFLATDPKELAKMFGRYRGSADTLRRLQGMAERPEITAKLDEVINEVEKTAPQP